MQPDRGSQGAQERAEQQIKAVRAPRSAQGSQIEAARAHRSAQDGKTEAARAPRSAQSSKIERARVPRSTQSSEIDPARAPRSAQGSQLEPGRAFCCAGQCLASQGVLLHRAMPFESAKAFCCAGPCFSSLPGRFATQGHAFRAAKSKNTTLAGSHMGSQIEKHNLGCLARSQPNRKTQPWLGAQACARFFGWASPLRQFRY